MVPNEGLSSDVESSIQSDSVSGAQTDLDNSSQIDSDSSPVFETLFFGSFPQSEDEDQDPEPIEWLILSSKEQDGQTALLLVSRYALDSKTICSEYKETTWEDSDLRLWLNSEFLQTAFSPEEQNRILTTTVTADPNPEFDTPQGQNTRDQIFLLSTKEVQKYFPSNDADLRCAPTALAASKLSYVNDRYSADGKPSCWWWLRTMGADSTSMSLVRIEGTIFNNGHFVDSESGCIRPAMWIVVN